MAELVGLAEQLVKVGLDLLAKFVEHGLAGSLRLLGGEIVASGGERARAGCETGF